ncbi:hypothetical protein DPEC_G00302210 [Dallia pectoralis]|uniref:Uncharacterized protein n=1 Tax=Dallia pectoralis TaxID=75939 RepID=A0ACC2FGX2_DALPE|nr:hypothetical protein DPEC_G00302210 [Dallia pectoralis]
MKCAFKVKLPQQDEHSNDSEDFEDMNLDNEDLWEDVSWDDEENTYFLKSRQRLSCFAHSLQLVIHDGMKEVKAISLTIAKTSRFTRLLHSSTPFKEKFEAVFGTGKSVPAANATRWNSTFKQIQALSVLDHKDLTEMCIVDFENVVFTSREWNQLKDLCAVLSPFSEATELTEGEKSVTISMVVPTVLDLNTHLIDMEESRGQCRPIAKALRQSLLKRFSGIFVKTKMAKKSEREEPFGHDVYFIAAMLDPQFGLSWVDLDVSNSNIENATLQNQFREDLKRTLRDTLLAEVETMVDAETLQNLAAGTAGTDSPKDSPPSKCPRIFARYQAHRNHHQSALNASISSQISKYFDVIQDSETDSALIFGLKTKRDFHSYTPWQLRSCQSLPPLHR